MKYKVISVLALIGLLSLTSCMQDYPEPSDVQKEIKVSATIDEAITAKAKSRASNSSWDEGDAIGIFMKKSGSVLSSSAFAINAKYTTNNGTSTFSPVPSNEVYFPFNNDKVDFIAYYPYKDELEDLNYPVDVSDQSSLSDIDLLYSNNEKGVNASKGIAELIFIHQLSKVILNISMSDDLQKDLTGLKAEFTNVKTKASFSLVDGTLANQSDSKVVSFNMSEDGKSGQAILLPTTSLDSMFLVLTLDSISYSLNLATSKEIPSFDKSTKQTLNVTLKPGDDPKIENVTATIEDWIDGTTVDVIADEDSTYAPTENPSGGNGEGEDTEGNGEGEETGDGSDLEEGDGTFEKPFTVTQAQNKVGEKKIWVKGYIVGGYNGSISRKSFVYGAAGEGGMNNIGIADLPTETDSIKTFPIDLIKDSPSNVRENINLLDHQTNFKKEVLLYGNIELIKGSPGMLSVKKAILDDKQYGDK